MISSFALIAALSAPAQAADIEQTATLNPFAIFWPALDGRFEKKLADNQGVYGTVTAGKFNPLVLRLLNGAVGAVSEGQVSIDMTVYAAGGGYNFYFDDFGYGWFAGGQAEFGRSAITITANSNSATVTTNAFTVAPVVGYKRVWDSGFTMQSELGYGYTVGIGDSTIEGTGISPQDLALGEVGGGGLVAAFLLGYSF